MSYAAYDDETRTAWGTADNESAEEIADSFSTRDEAVASALANERHWLFRGVYPDPVKVARAVADAVFVDITERMEDLASNEGYYSGDDELFDFDKDAKAGLVACLAAWATTHARALKWTAFSCERVAGHDA